MDRIALLLILAASVLAFGAHAADSPRTYRVAMVFSTSPAAELAGREPAHPLMRAFVQGMRDLGYVEGENLILERRSAEGHFERFPGIFRELVANKVDAIVTVSTALTRAASEVTQTVPIVMAASQGPVEAGLVQTLARPGGNITGFAADTGPELPGKRLQLLSELVPKAARMALIAAEAGIDTGEDAAVIAAADKMRIKLLVARHNPTDYAEAFSLIERQRPGALMVSQSPTNYANRRLIVDFATKARLPTMFSNREYVELGGLASYGIDVPSLCRGAARYVDRILKGEKPGNLPIERPAKFELVINLKTAKLLNITIPQAMLLQADRVVE